MAPEVLIAVIGVFVAMCVLVGTATSWALARTAPERRRVRAVVQSAGPERVVQDASLVATPDPALARLSKILPKSPKDMSNLQRTLTRAGFHSSRALLVYSVAEVALPILLFFGTIMLLGFAAGLIPALVLAVVGYYAPSFYVGYKTSERQRAIRNGLPDALDLLTVCVEAGSG